MIEMMFTRDGGPDGLAGGLFLIQRHRANRVDIPVRIWWGPPADPETGELLDRSPRWRIHLAGTEFDGEPVRLGNITIYAVTDFWPTCATAPIDEREYAYRLERQAWAAIYDPDDPFATPGGRVDPMTATLPFME